MEIIMDRRENALEVFKTGFNCSQAVLSVFAEECRISRDDAFRLSTGFGGGMGRKTQVCGAVTGGIIALGARFGRTESDSKDCMVETYEKTQSLIDIFTEKMEMISCTKLLNYCDLTSKKGQNEFVEKGLHAKVCQPCVATAVEILEELMKSN
jgi:C_GCAxxG_C_C family probable redox protein